MYSTLLLVAAAPATEPAVGEPVRVSESQVAELLRNPEGGTLVVSFFASWCRPCRHDLPLVERTVLGHPGVRALHVSLDEVRDAPKVLRMQVELGLRLPMVHLQTDAPGAAAARLVPRWPDVIPVTLVLGPGGAEKARFQGTIDPVKLDLALGADPA